MFYFAMAEQQLMVTYKSTYNVFFIGFLSEQVEEKKIRFAC
jgi:hypothetical protein